MKLYICGEKNKMSEKQDLVDEIDRCNEKYLSELTDRLSLGDSVVPFVGAGMSCPVYGTWETYLRSIVPKYDKVSHEVLSRQLAEGDYEGAAQKIRDNYGIEFYNQTEEYFGVDKIKYESISHAARLLPHLFCGTVITTNLDQILETVYHKEKIPIRTLLAGHSRLVQSLTRDGNTCLWKIHGDVEDRESWVLTKDDYIKQYGTADGRLFQMYLKQVIQGKVLLFLGCSLKSDMIVHVLEEIGRNNPYIKHYAILPVENGYRFKAADREAFSRRCRKLGRLGIKPIWYPDGKHEFVERYLLRLLQAGKYPLEQQKMPVTGIPYPYELDEDRYIKKKLMI